MASLRDRKLIALYGITPAIIHLMAIAFIIAISGQAYCISPSPVISAYPVMNVASGSNITVSGQNFTPNGIAVLYGTGIPESYTANTDQDGNITLLITQAMSTPYQIYALDENSMSRKSNTITIYPLLNDAPLSTPITSLNPTINANYPNGTPHAPRPPISPALQMDAAYIILIMTGAALLIVYHSKKK